MTCQDVCGNMIVKLKDNNIFISLFTNSVVQKQSKLMEMPAEQN
jgi:hypothetical protein